LENEIWHIERHEQVGVLETASITSIHAAAFSPDGRYIATASDHIQVWPAFPTTQELMARARELHPDPLDDDQRRRFFLDPPGGMSARPF
jgi:hypothetical protein